MIRARILLAGIGARRGAARPRLAIARALAKGSGVLIMDEPTAELDPTNRASLVAPGNRTRCGVAIVVVSHEADVIDRANQIFAVPKLR
jgi:ABC-type lipoprotein export system ATPase subunit